MADVADPATQQLLRTIIREEAPVIVRGIIREEVPVIVRGIIREETADLREDIKLIKNVQGQQGIQIREINIGLTSVKSTLRQHGSDIRKLGVLLEDLDDRFKTAGEIQS